MKYTDPSGFFFKKLFKKIKKWIKPIVAIAVGILTAGLGVAAYMSVFLNTAFSFSAGLIAVTSGVVGSIGFGAVVAAGAAMGFASGAIMTGSLSGALEGAAWGAIGGAISYGIGHGNGIFKSIRNAGGRDLMHGISRAVITRAQGGKFSAGFWSGFASSSLAPISESFNVYEARVVSNAIIGGTVSEISGGKFANGAVTGAFVYMFNHSMQTNKSLQEYALKGKYRDVKEDMRFTANRLDNTATKYSNLGAALITSGQFVASSISYTAATFAIIGKHLTLASIGETDWISLTRDFSTKIGFYKTGKYSNLAEHGANEAMKMVQ